MLVFETERLSFYKYQANDFDIYQQLMRNPEVATYITVETPTLEQSKNRFEYILSLNLQEKNYGFFKVLEKEAKQPLGLAKLIITDKKQAEIGYAINPIFWRKGYGTEITRGLIAYSKQNTFITKLIAVINPENTNSKLLLIKANFSFWKNSMENNGHTSHIYRLNI